MRARKRERERERERESGRHREDRKNLVELSAQQELVGGHAMDITVREGGRRTARSPDRIDEENEPARGGAADGEQHIAWFETSARSAMRMKTSITIGPLR